MIYELLKKGQNNAMSSEELIKALPIQNKRVMQEIIAKERESGKVILSTTKNGGGYYLPGTREELTEFINTLSKRAGNTFKALRSAKALLKRIDENGEEL